MKDVNAFAIFCEDVRREAQGRNTIIGVMPDTVRVPSFPGEMRRLALYIRLRLNIEASYESPIFIRVTSSPEEVLLDDHEPIPKEVVERSVSGAKQRGVPFGTIFARFELTPVSLQGPVKLTATLEFNDEQEVIGFLQILEKPHAPVVQGDQSTSSQGEAISS